MMAIYIILSQISPEAFRDPEDFRNLAAEVPADTANHPPFFTDRNRGRTRKDEASF